MWTIKPKHFQTDDDKQGIIDTILHLRNQRKDVYLEECMCESTEEKVSEWLTQQDREDLLA